MTSTEKDAIISYLEFHLVKHCEQFEIHIDPEVVGDMYDSAYGLLNEIDGSLQDIIDFTPRPKIKKK